MMQKGQILIWIIVGVMVTAVAGGAYYFGYDHGWEKSLPTLMVSQTPQPTPSPSDEITNWKTYTNTEYNFSIKYPNNWQPGWGTIGDGPTEEQMRQSNSLGWVRNNERSPFAIFSFRVIGPCSTTLDNCVKDFQTSNANGFDNQDQVQEETKFLNKDSLTINHTRKQYGTSDLLIKKRFFTYAENLWLIETQIDNSTTQSVKNEIEKEINQILSTFKFL